MTCMRVARYGVSAVESLLYIMISSQLVHVSGRARKLARTGDAPTLYTIDYAALDTLTIMHMFLPSFLDLCAVYR